MRVYINYDKIIYESSVIDDKVKIKFLPLESNCNITLKNGIFIKKHHIIHNLLHNL
jgi:hypothetical protein